MILVFLAEFLYIPTTCNLNNTYVYSLSDTKKVWDLKLNAQIGRYAKLLVRSWIEGFGVCYLSFAKDPFKDLYILHLRTEPLLNCYT